ncbi:hypothetical protein [Streptomyces sp. NPDC003077]|uniref:hypothetical protein n=1 Tax=Streptomyces sp. NPDC003077 TaxID=3154443 RepID=UPI0033A82C25
MPSSIRLEAAGRAAGASEGVSLSGGAFGPESGGAAVVGTSSASTSLVTNAASSASAVTAGDAAAVGDSFASLVTNGASYGRQVRGAVVGGTSYAYAPAYTPHPLLRPALPRSCSPPSPLPEFLLP